MKLKAILMIFAAFLISACVSNTHDSAERSTASKDVLLKTMLNDKKTVLTVIHDGKSLDLKMKVPKDFSYESHSTRSHGNVLFVIYQFNDESSAASEVVAIDKNANKIIWERRVSSFNVSVPLVDGDYVYVSAMGQFSKLNAQTGRPAWHNENLTGEVEVSGTADVTKDGDIIELSEEVKFSDKTGHIVSMGGQ